MSIAETPAPPYYAVIFSSFRTDSTTNDGGSVDDDNNNDDSDGYEEMAHRMMDLAARQPGFLGVEGTRHGLGITISYWVSLEAIHSWKQNTEHQVAQQLGRDRWYSAYKTRICKVEREYGFERTPRLPPPRTRP
jgi:heme-degrading monooxygenase HmoA